MKHMEQLPRLIDWMQGTAEILETARRRMLCVAEKALVDHPEWGDLTAEDAMRGLQ